jgi:hypothetical protein
VIYLPFVPRRQRTKRWRVLAHNAGPFICESQIPDHVLRSLDRAAALGIDGPRADVEWRSPLTPKGARARDGAQVLNTVTETIMVPDYTFNADAVQTGDIYKYTLWGDMSTVVTTPGTYQFTLRWGGVAGTSLAQSTAYTPKTTVTTTSSGIVEFMASVRSVGASGSIFAMGRLWIPQELAAFGAADFNHTMIPLSAPAATTVDTTAAKALSPTVKFSVSTATTQWTTHIGVLEALQ